VRRLAFSRLVSLTGTDAAFVALAFEIYRLTGSAVWVSATLFLTFGVTGLLRPVAGLIGDRLDRKRVMVISEALGGVAFAMLALAQSPGMLVAIAFVATVIATPFGPTAGAAIPNLIASDDDLAWANSRVSFSATVGGTIGPAIGGALVPAIGASGVFLLNAASFAVSAVIIWRIRGTFARASGERTDERGAMAGFRRIRGDRLLLGIAIAWTLMYFAVDIVLVGDLPLSRSFGVGSFGYSLFLSAWSGAAAFGYWVAGRLSTHERPALIGGAAGVIFGYGITAIAPWFWLALAGVAVAGGVDAIGSVAGFTLIQRRTPDEVRARTLGAISSLGLGANAVAFTTAGFLVDALGPRVVYGIGAAVAVLATGILVRSLGGDSVVEARPERSTR
jgi:MFS family permease